ncbi:hypothetical protein MRB53_008638 [Persea americana]|uniref:Uncharacterized protein n=1 Tax=Persea americana TaxID=3435 RepID=A0ACC2MMM4_PERAE|nr:hypothetical protein MRB53_008638 [Persea americana]
MMKSSSHFFFFFFFFFFFSAVLTTTTTTIGRRAAGDDAPYRDPRLPIEARISDLLSRMTLAEKIGQMTQIDRSVASSDVIRDLSIGSVLNGGDSAPSPDWTPSMWADMVDGYQQSALSSRLGIPMIYGTDAVHGHNNVFGSTVFPHNIGLGATRDADLVLRIGKATALEIRGSGIPYTFAPCLAVCRDPRWGRCYESYSEDTEIVRSMAKMIIGLQGSPPQDHPAGYPFLASGGRNVMACAKHFTGDGGTQRGINENNTIATYGDLWNIHIRPYIDALAMGVSTVMVSYSSWNGVKMHGNPYLLTRVLKQQMGFQGFLITDWEGIDRMTSPPGSDYKNSVKTAINAGIDMVMVPKDYQRFMTDLTELVSSGQVPLSRIDDAVRRILRVKFVAGVFEYPMADRSLLGMVGLQEHRELAREAVRKSLVLLKNGENKGRRMLPLSKNAPRILVAGTHANNLGYQCGGWTITWQGKSGQITLGTTILEGIKGVVSKQTQVVFEEKPDEHFFENNGNFSYAVVAVGEAPYAETNGDNGELRVPMGGAEAIERVCGAVKCVVIVVAGRPLVIEPYVERIDALVAAWLPGSEGGKGIADVIFGDYEFHGKLPRTWFRRVDQLPMNVGDSHYDPLYPFGFGLRMNLLPPRRPVPSNLLSTPSNSSAAPAAAAA